MEFEEVVRRRRMARNYRPDPIPAEIVDRAVRNAQRAPSAGFSQGWAFLVLDEPADVRRYWEATADLADPDDWLTGMMRAPVLIIPCSSKAAYLSRYAEADKGFTDRSERHWPKPFWDMDAAMASLLILLTATDSGIGSCFFGIPPDRDRAVRDAFGIPDDHDPVGAITLGYPAEGGARGSTSSRPRRTDVIHRGRWSV